MENKIFLVKIQSLLSKVQEIVDKLKYKRMRYDHLCGLEFRYLFFSNQIHLLDNTYRRSKEFHDLMKQFSGDINYFESLITNLINIVKKIDIMEIMLIKTNKYQEFIKECDKLDKESDKLDEIYEDKFEYCEKKRGYYQMKWNKMMDHQIKNNGTGII